MGPDGRKRPLCYQWKVLTYPCRRARSLKLNCPAAHQSHGEVLARLVAHVENTSIAEALVRLVGAEEQTATFIAPDALAWLPATNLLQQLLDCLDASASLNARENGAIVLGAIARSSASPLTHSLGEGWCPAAATHALYQNLLFCSCERPRLEN